MKLLINCANLRFGGGKTVAINIIEYFLSNTNHNITIVVPFNCGYEKYKNSKARLVIVPSKYNHPLNKLKLNSKLLPEIEHQYRPDFVFSLGNIAFKCKAPQLLLIQLSHLVYPESDVWKKLKFKEWLLLKLMVNMIKNNLKNADYIRLQTKTMMDRFQKLFPEFKDIGILPNSISVESLQKIKPLSLANLPPKIPLLFFSKYYAHKNYEVLFQVAEIVKARQLPYSFTITIDKHENLDSALFLEKINNNGLTDIIINRGNIAFEKIPSLYEEHYGLFLPTSLESYSGTYIEAQYFGRPIFTSNRDFAIEICKEEAYYFDPNDAMNILEVIENAFRNKSEMQQKIDKARQYSRNIESWQQIGDKLNAFLEENIHKL